MRDSLRSTFVLVSAVMLGLWLAAPASAAVCGDADGSGSVTVTDGVQVLRAAADLSSDCSQHASECDVDGNGSVTVSDGVNVLRLAADLSVSTNCQGSGGVDTDVAGVAQVTVPFLTLGVSALGEVTIGSASAADTQDCEDGGSRTTTSGGGTASVTFNACRVSQAGLGHFQFDGHVELAFGIPTGTVQFELQVTDLDHDQTNDFDGTIQGQVRIPQGGVVVDGGPVEVHQSEGGPVLFTLTFHELTIDSDAHFVSGSAEAEDVNDHFADLQSAEFEVQNSTTADLHVVRDDQSTDDFTVNLQTGDITPKS